MSNNCGPVTGTLDVTEPAAVTGSASVTSAILCNGGTATVTLTGAGGTSPLSYTFNNVTNGTGIFTGISAGAGYAWSITDANNCGPVTGSLDVAQPATITGSASVTTAILCNGGVATVTLTGAGGMGPLSYTFNNVTNGTGIFTGIAAGAGYAWSITDANNCGPITGTLNVTEAAAVTGSASITSAILCNGGTATVTLTGAGGTSPLSYTFNNVTNGTGIFTGISAGTGYVWSITDANNCGPVTGTLNITEPAVVTVTAASVTPASVCGSETVTFTATPSEGSIVWYNALTGGNIVTPPTSVSTTTTLYAEAVSAQGCVSAVRTPVTVTVYASPAVPTTGSNTYPYNGTLRTASVTAGINEVVDWYTTATGGILTTAPSGTNAGTYTAWAEARNTITGCVSASRLQVTLTITSVDITVTADIQSKVYGNVDPVLTYQITSGALVGTDIFIGALTRTVGENIGTYAITQGTLALSSNYTFIFVGANLTITTRPVTVTADPKTKDFGTADPPLTYTITSGSLAANGDAFSGSLTRDPGENAGTYPIRQGTLSLGSNYALTYVGDNLTITGRAITITADAKTKFYGDTDPALTYQITSGSLSNGDVLTGSLTRDAGEDVGTYTINLGTLGSGSNYAITFIGADFDLIARPVTVTADDASKVYGDADFLTYLVTSGSLVGTDAFSGELAHDGGEDVGTYPIVIGTLALGSNYSLTFIEGTLTITAKPIEVNAITLSKVYGDSDPMLTYTISSGSLESGDAFTGGLMRDPGENAGTYAINQGDLALSSNYALTFIGADFTITQRLLTITADDLTKVYGTDDPELTFQITSGNLAGNGDAFTGALTREPGEDVGTYIITLGTVSLNGNYSLTFIGAVLTIVPSSVAITVTADALSKVYGDSDPQLTYQITTGTLVGTDSFTGALTREPGENAGTYAILQGTLALSGNYIMIFQGADFTITQRPVTVAADNKSKVFGEDDPELTYEITSGELAANGDAFTGALTRTPGEDVGSYTITQGTLSLGGNYDITFEEGQLNINSGFEMTAYPNPFKDHIYFEFDLNNDSDVLLEIFNVAGAKIATVFTGFALADHYRLEYLPERMSDGAYIYRLSFNGHVMAIGKIIHHK